MNLTDVKAIFGDRPPGKDPTSFLMCVDEPSVLTRGFCMTWSTHRGWSLHPGSEEYYHTDPEYRASGRAYYKYEYTVEQFVAETFIDLL